MGIFFPDGRRRPPDGWRRPLGPAVLALLAAATLFVAAQEQGPTTREFNVGAQRYAYSPARLEVSQDDIVKVTFHSDDIAHSFTIDSYRISKRAGANQSVVFEFRADQPGRYPFYCNLGADDGCKQMKGELVVKAR